jgi:catechol 2,3-dioxygenase-like lactoylglutathione lyase family enzyme
MTDGDFHVRGVLETCLYAVDLAEAAAFYERVLGLEPFSRVAGRHVFFRCGRGVFLLFNPEKTREGGDVPAHGARGPGHVAFAVPSPEMDGWKRRLLDLGTPIEQEVEWPGGGRSLYLRDPAGNSVELATPALWSMEE